MDEAAINKQELRKNMMLTEPIGKIVLKMALPTIVAFIITAAYNLADTYFVSSLGTSATAAVSVNASLDQIIMMAGSMLAIGANSYIARLMGARNEKKAANVLSTAFFIAVALGLLFAIFGISFMKPLVRLLGATDDCERYSVQYATYVLLVAPFMAANFVLNQCLRAEGSAMLSMIGLGAGGILNCILDPIFIFNLGLGVAGASIATAISKLVSFAILMYPYLSKRTTLRIAWKKIRLSMDILSEIIKMGAPSLLRTGLGVVSAIVLNNLAGDISDSVLAGIGVPVKVMMFPIFIVLGFCNGVQPVAGFNWGAGRYDRVKECYRFSLGVTIIGAAVLGAALFIFAEPLIGLFTETDAEMLKTGVLCIRTQSVIFPVHAWVVLVNIMCAALGKAKGAFLLATSRQGTCFLPIVYLMAHLWGATGLAWVQAVADGLSVLIAVPIIISLTRELRGRIAGQASPAPAARPETAEVQP